MLLVGDTILDVYTYCNIVCEALYAPVPEAEEIRSSISFGGNSLVASNMLELGAKVTFLSVIGDDDAATQYDSFKHPNLEKIFLIDKTRKTTVKQRWFADGKALLQVNTVDNHDLSPSLEKKVFSILEKEIKKTDVVVVMDPQHGFLTKNIIKKMLELCEVYQKPLHVDVQISHRESKHELYKGADTFFLNRNEARALVTDFSIASSKKALEKISKSLNAKNIIIKLGEKGSVAFLNNTFIKTPALAVDAVDVCGAGDAFLAAFSLCDGDDPTSMLKIASIWGSLSTTIHGTIPPKKRDLLNRLDE